MTGIVKSGFFACKNSLSAEEHKNQEQLVKDRDIAWFSNQAKKMSFSLDEIREVLGSLEVYMRDKIALKEEITAELQLLSAYRALLEMKKEGLSSVNFTN